MSAGPPADPPGSASGDDKPEAGPSEGGQHPGEDPPEWKPTTDPVDPVPLAGRVDLDAAVLSVSDQFQLRPLMEYLRLAAPNARVVLTAGRAGSGELGALDVLTIVADSSVLAAAVKTLPEFLRSRRAGISVTVTAKGRQLMVTAANADEVTRIIEGFLGS